MEPYTLAYSAGHSDFGTTRQYVHPNLETGREAMESARGAQATHNSGHKAENAGATGEPAEGGNLISDKGLGWYARADSNGRPSAPEADALSS